MSFMESLSGGGGSAIGAAHDVTSDAIRTYAAYEHDENMQRREFSYQQRLNSQMASLAAEARRSSAADMAEGLKRAGLNPALAGGSGFGSVSSGGGVSAPSNTPAPVPRSNLGQLALEQKRYMESERELMRSQAAANTATAEAAHEEATAKQLENQNRMRYNEMVNGALVNWADRILEDDDASVEDKAAAESIRFGGESAFNAGTLKAMDDWNKMSADFKKRAADRAEDEFRRKLALEKDKNRLYEQIWSSDKVQQDALFAQMNVCAAQRAKLLSDASLNKKSESELDARIQEYKANIHKLYIEAAKILHSDPAEMSKREDWNAFMLYYFNNFVEMGGDAAKVYMGAKGFSAAKGAKGSLQPLTTTPQSVNLTPMGDLSW